MNEMELTKRFLEGVANIPGVAVCGPQGLEHRVGVISLDFIGQDNAEVAYRLEVDHGILTRCGLHCAPSAHKSLDTFPRGTVRFSLGFASTEEDVDTAIAAIAAVCQ
jgi:selenocysteine lyase/cysteine desulfurase